MVFVLDGYYGGAPGTWAGNYLVRKPSYALAAAALGCEQMSHSSLEKGK